MTARPPLSSPDGYQPSGWYAYPNVSKMWRPEEDNYVLESLRVGRSLKEMMYNLQRAPDSIKSRAGYLIRSLHSQGSSPDAITRDFNLSVGYVKEIINRE